MLVSDSLAVRASLLSDTPSWAPGVVSDPEDDYCRRETVRAVVGVLRGADGHGIVLVGDHGMGKTYLARKAVELLRSEYLIVQAQGSSVASTLPYGALRPLLNDIAAAAEHPLKVVQALSRHLRQLAKNRAVILYVDNVQDLDELSALVIAQLAEKGVVRLLAVCNDLPSAPGELIALWRHGSLERLDVGPFSQDETTEWVRTSTGSDVSRAVAAALWDASGGNPRFLDVIFREQSDAKTIVPQDGFWVLSGKPFEYQATTVATVLAGSGPLLPAEQRVLEVLALTGGLALDELIAVSDATALDALEQKGSLKITAGENPWVSLSNQLAAQVLRRRVPSGRSRELHAAVSAAQSPVGPAASTTLALAFWALDCGAELSQDAAREAARMANDSGRPHDALRMLGYLDPQHRRAALLEEATAYHLLGESDRACGLLSGVQEIAGEWPLEKWVEAMILRTRVSGPECSSRRRDILQAVRDRLAAEKPSEPATDSSVDGLRDQLALAEAELAIFDGRYREAGDILERVRRESRSEVHRIEAAKNLCRTFVVAGRQMDAQKLARLFDFCRYPGSPAGLSPEPIDWVLSKVLLAGAQQGWDADTVPTHPGTMDGARAAAAEQLLDGLLAAYSGRAERALAHLLPALAQLRAWGSAGSARVAAAAVAYCYSLLGENDHALRYLNSFSSASTATDQSGARLEATAGVSRLVTSACSYFQVLASAELASHDKAVVRLFTLADDEKRRRAPSLELVFLSAAVRQGCTDGAQRLLTVAASVQGRFAEVCGVYGRAVRAQDAQQLVRAAEMAADMGNDLFARDAARAALKIGTDTADRSVMRSSQQIIRNCIAHLGGIKQSSDDGQTLTAREQEVAAWAAAGISNRAIAAKMNISVRTVEGHLYQVYGKLQVTSRNELKNTFA